MQFGLSDGKVMIPPNLIEDLNLQYGEELLLEQRLRAQRVGK